MAKFKNLKKGVSGVLAATTVSSSVGNIANSVGVKTGIVKPNLEASGSNGGIFKLPAGIKYDDMRKKCADMLSAYTIIKYFPEKIKNLLNDNSGTEFTFNEFMNEVRKSSVDYLKDYFGLEIDDIISLTGWDYDKKSATLTIYKDAGATASATWKDVDDIKNNVQKVVFKKDVTKIDGSIFNDVNVKTFDFSDYSADVFKNITMENLLASSTDFEIKVPSTVLTANYLPRGICEVKLQSDGEGNYFDSISKVKFCEYDGIGVLKIYENVDDIIGHTSADDRPWNSVATEIAYVYFPNDITRICKSDFSGCTKLKVLDFSGITDLSNVEVDPDAFTGCNEIDTIIVNNTYAGEEGKLKLPDWINNIREEAKVYSISNDEITKAGKYYEDDGIYINYTLDGGEGTCVFPGKTSYQGELHGADESISSVKLILGSNRTTVPDGGFVGCSSLTSVSMPNVETIGLSAFQDCKALISVSMPNVTKIGEGAFGHTAACDKLKSVSMPNVTSVGNTAFLNCKGLTSVSMPKVESIGDGAFNQCESLTSVSMPNVTSIGKSAFLNCTDLISVSMPNVTTIYKDAFAICIGLKEIDISGVTNLESLKPVYDDVNRELKFGVGSDAFSSDSGCPILEKVIVHESLKSNSKTDIINALSKANFRVNSETTRIYYKDSNGNEVEIK